MYVCMYVCKTSLYKINKKDKTNRNISFVLFIFYHSQIVSTLSRLQEKIVFRKFLK